MDDWSRSKDTNKNLGFFLLIKEEITALSETNIIFLKSTEEQKGLMLSPFYFIQISGSWPLLGCVLVPKVTVTARSLRQ